MGKSLNDRLKNAYSAAEQSNEGDVASLLGIAPDPEDTLYKQPLHLNEPIPTEPINSVPSIPVYPQENFIQETSQEIYQEPINYQPVQNIQPDIQTKDIEEKITTKVSIQDISRIIKISDKYHSFEDGVKKNICKILQCSSDLSEIIHSVLYIDNENKTGFVDLVNLKEEERTSRAFTLMSLTESRVKKIRELISLFGKDISLTETDKVGILRETENAINNLSDTVFQYLIPIRDLFKLE